MPKVSVVIPVYNVEVFLPECLDSAINQTLDDIEIICVNDGSSDSSGSILENYAAKDERIKIINKENTGYGNTMNVGISQARGTYIAILESDDCIEHYAYQKLYEIAEKRNLDIVKGDYYFLEGFGKESSLEHKAVSSDPRVYNRVLKPLRKPWTFNLPMMNWMGLINAEFLRKNEIVHNETPGASHQDVGFWFTSFCVAQRLLYINEPFYKYRQDNASSSMKDNKTAFFVQDEFRFIREYLERHPSLMKKVLPIFFYRKFASSMFSYENAAESIRLPLLERLSVDYNADKTEGLLNLKLFSASQKEELTLIMNDPLSYYESHRRR